MKEYGIVILNYNKGLMTVDVIKSIIKYENIDNYSLIIVDNASNQDERQHIIEYISKFDHKILEEESLPDSIDIHDIYFLILKQNYGYAIGNNRGLEIASKLNIKYSVVLNNDVFFVDKTLDLLKENFSHDEKIALVGPKVIDKNGNVQGPFKKTNFYYEFFLPLFFPILLLVSKILHRPKIISTQKISDYPYRLMGCFLMFKTNVLRSIDYFDENTFLYAEEVIIAEKLLIAEAKTFFDNRVTVIHMHKQSTKLLQPSFLFNEKAKSEKYYLQKYLSYNRFALFLIKFSKNIYRVHLYIIGALTKSLRKRN